MKFPAITKDHVMLGAVVVLGVVVAIGLVKLGQRLADRAEANRSNSEPA